MLLPKLCLARVTGQRLRKREELGAAAETTARPFARGWLPVLPAEPKAQRVGGGP